MVESARGGADQRQGALHHTFGGVNVIIRGGSWPILRDEPGEAANDQKPAENPDAGWPEELNHPGRDLLDQLVAAANMGFFTLGGLLGVLTPTYVMKETPAVQSTGALAARNTEYWTSLRWNRGPSRCASASEGRVARVRFLELDVHRLRLVALLVRDVETGTELVRRDGGNGGVVDLLGFRDDLLDR